MDPKETATAERLWGEKSKDGKILSYHMGAILPQIRKNLEFDEEILEEMIADLDKNENGTLTRENFDSILARFLEVKI